MSHKNAGASIMEQQTYNIVFRAWRYYAVWFVKGQKQKRMYRDALIRRTEAALRVYVPYGRVFDLRTIDGETIERFPEISFPKRFPILFETCRGVRGLTFSTWRAIQSLFLPMSRNSYNSTRRYAFKRLSLSPVINPNIYIYIYALISFYDVFDG